MAHSVNDNSIESLIFANKALRLSLQKSQGIGLGLEKAGNRFEEINHILPSLEAAVRPSKSALQQHEIFDPQDIGVRKRFRKQIYWKRGSGFWRGSGEEAAVGKGVPAAKNKEVGDLREPWNVLGLDEGSSSKNGNLGAILQNSNASFLENLANGIEPNFLSLAIRK
ncbi:hypothetical protein ACFX15_031679 [Malus domestica]